MAMKKTERFRALRERGYFPEELPPPFHCDQFAKYRSTIAKAWHPNAANYSKSSYGIYSIPRVKRVRRNLAVVNPIAQFFLAKLISDNWVEIKKFLKRSKYSVEIPDVVANQKRAVPPPDFNLVGLRRFEISASHKHALASDISRFYGTLYTHTIPWALHTKSWCKTMLHDPSYNAKLGNRLDVAVRKAQDNQTIGIPIGPDTSRIISEIVAVAIDEYLQTQLKLDRSRAFRNVDDWYIGFDSSGEAENAVATLATACRDFELE
jgi:hypothetical protein